MLAPPYKAIVLVTPGGDILYAIDRDKTRHWHLDLCLGIQALLNLREPPHFLIPSYTATLDTGTDPLSPAPRIFAEIHAPVHRYRYCLSALFDLQNVSWKLATSGVEPMDPEILQSYARQFPELWQNHNWIVPLEKTPSILKSRAAATMESTASSVYPAPVSYIFRLYVSGHGAQTERSLRDLHRCLKQGLNVPYSLKVIDIQREPELAEKDQVMAIPTLIRICPQPTRRIVGHFQDDHQLLKLLK